MTCMELLPYPPPKKKAKHAPSLSGELFRFSGEEDAVSRHLTSADLGKTGTQCQGQLLPQAGAPPRGPPSWVGSSTWRNVKAF